MEVNINIDSQRPFQIGDKRLEFWLQGRSVEDCNKIMKTCLDQATKYATSLSEIIHSYLRLTPPPSCPNCMSVKQKVLADGFEVAVSEWLRKYFGAEIIMIAPEVMSCFTEKKNGDISANITALSRAVKQKQVLVLK